MSVTFLSFVEYHESYASLLIPVVGDTSSHDAGSSALSMKKYWSIALME